MASSSDDINGPDLAFSVFSSASNTSTSQNLHSEGLPDAMMLATTQVFLPVDGDGHRQCFETPLSDAQPDNDIATAETFTHDERVSLQSLDNACDHHVLHNVPVLVSEGTTTVSTTALSSFSLRQYRRQSQWSSNFSSTGELRKEDDQYHDFVVSSSLVVLSGRDDDEDDEDMASWSASISAAVAHPVALTPTAIRENSRHFNQSVHQFPELHEEQRDRQVPELSVEDSSHICQSFDKWHDRDFGEDTAFASAVGTRHHSGRSFSDDPANQGGTSQNETESSSLLINEIKESSSPTRRAFRSKFSQTDPIIVVQQPSSPPSSSSSTHTSLTSERSSEAEVVLAGVNFFSTEGRREHQSYPGLDVEGPSVLAEPPAAALPSATPNDDERYLFPQPASSITIPSILLEQNPQKLRAMILNKKKRMKTHQEQRVVTKTSAASSSSHTPSSLLFSQPVREGPAPTATAVLPLFHAIPHDDDGDNGNNNRYGTAVQKNKNKKKKKHNNNNNNNIQSVFQTIPSPSPHNDTTPFFSAFSPSAPPASSSSSSSVHHTNTIPIARHFSVVLPESYDDKKAFIKTLNDLYR